MTKLFCLIPLTLACLPPAAQADNCDAIKEGIAGRFRTGGVPHARLVVVDAGSAQSGRVVGTCANSTRQIVYLAAGKAAAPAAQDSLPAERAPAASATMAAAGMASDGIPTECKDGTIVIGPDCNNPRAVRMTSREIDKSVQPGRR